MSTTLLDHNGKAISYAHAWDSMYKGIDEQGPYYEVSYFFEDWADSDVVPNQMKGISGRVGGVSTYSSPHQHPLSPNLYCFNVRVEGLGNPVLNTKGYPDYDGGFRAICQYRAPQILYEKTDDPQNLFQLDPANPILWCTQDVDYTTESLSVPNNTYTWVSDGKPVGIPIRVEIGVTVLVLTFPHLPWLPIGYFRKLRGKVNNAPFLGAAAGHVIFRGARTTQDLNTDGTRVKRAVLTFCERDYDWNSFLRPDGLTWDLVTDKAGRSPFTVDDLSPLLRL